MTDETVFDEIPEPELTPPPPEGTNVVALGNSGLGAKFPPSPSASPASPTGT